MSGRASTSSSRLSPSTRRRTVAIRGWLPLTVARPSGCFTFRQTHNRSLPSFDLNCLRALAPTTISRRSRSHPMQDPREKHIGGARQQARIGLSTAMHIQWAVPRWQNQFGASVPPGSARLLRTLWVGPHVNFILAQRILLDRGAWNTD